MLSFFSPVTDTASNRLQTFLGTVDFSILAIIDFTLVGLILYWLYRILKETRAFGILYGILVLVAAYVLSKLLRLDLMALLIANFLTLLFVAIPVLFQPELRRLLERLGRTRTSGLTQWNKSEYQDTLTRVTEAVRLMALANTGAIIVFKRTTGLTDLMTSGTPLDAVVSTPLILNIFFNKSPLHDGAVIIDRDRIVTAGAMLPLSEREYGHTLGARHRAAVGLTEQCDAVVLVVSEERGLISLVVGGKITPGISPDIINDVLSEFLTRNAPRSFLDNLRRKKSTNAANTDHRKVGRHPKNRKKESKR